jgi:hypothetical protein
MSRTEATLGVLFPWSVLWRRHQDLAGSFSVERQGAVQVVLVGGCLDDV